MLLQTHETHGYASAFFTPANAESYDSVARWATLGQDIAWKKSIIAAIGSQKKVLELASGTGILTSMLESKGNSVTGLDLTRSYLVQARKKARFSLMQGTAEALPFKREAFDAIASSYLMKYVDMAFVARECFAALRPGGIVVFHDFTLPRGQIMRAFWKIHFRVLRTIGAFAPSWRIVFQSLEKVIADSFWEHKALLALKDAGFVHIRLQYFTAGTAAMLSAEKP